jgi:hypothetical protein
LNRKACADQLRPHQAGKITSRRNAAGYRQSKRAALPTQRQRTIGRGKGDPDLLSLNEAIAPENCFGLSDWKCLCTTEMSRTAPLQ